MKPARGWLYPGMALVILATVVLGFGPTYFWRTMSDRPPLTTIVQVHGAAFTGWVLLFLTQVTLIATGRRAVHRALGVAGVVLAVVMLGLGWEIAIEQARRDSAAGRAAEALGFLIIPIGDLLSFAVLVASGIAYRAKPDVHRRLMLLATIAILPAAIGRIPGLEGPPGFIVYFVGLLAVAPLHDRFTGRRVHPVSLWGGAVVFAFLLGRFFSQQSAAWRAIAECLV